MNGDDAKIGVAAIVSPCSARKAKLPLRELRSDKLPRAGQQTVAAMWLKRLCDAPLDGLVAARDLYSGEGVRRLQVLADALDLPFFVISAGLGLVSGDRPVPPYDLTLSPAAPDRLPLRINGAFSVERWWKDLQASPYRSPLTDLGRRDGRILVALTRPYAELIGPALGRLRAPMRNRLRLLGPGLIAHLPKALHRQVVSYDRRLDTFIPGTRLNAAARSAEHFAHLVSARNCGSVEDDQALVDDALSTAASPLRIKRPRVNDAVLVKHIEELMRQGHSATSALKHLRSKTRVACEERRFRRLYEAALG